MGNILCPFFKFLWASDISSVASDMQRSDLERLSSSSDEAEQIHMFYLF